MVIALRHETWFHVPHTAYKLNIFQSCHLKLNMFSLKIKQNSQINNFKVKLCAWNVGNQELNQHYFKIMRSRWTKLFSCGLRPLNGIGFKESEMKSIKNYSQLKKKYQSLALHTFYIKSASESFPSFQTNFLSQHFQEFFKIFAAKFYVNHSTCMQTYVTVDTISIHKYIKPEDKDANSDRHGSIYISDTSIVESSLVNKMAHDIQDTKIR